MPLVKVYDAPTVYRHLNGIVNIFKPAGMRINHVRTAVLHKICTELNELEVRKPRKLEVPLLEPGGGANPILRKLEQIDLADDILATGPRYQIKDINCRYVNRLGEQTSGVLIFGINNGIKQSSKMAKNLPLRAYHVTGRLGIATENFLPNSRKTVRADYHHVHPERMSALASSMQASHQRKMYELCGVDIQSQAAYEFACKGLIRPKDTNIPVIYGIKLIDFKRPYFTLEIHTINESETYLAAIINDMGIELHSVAHCTGIRCIRYGQFTLETALLRHNWNLNDIVHNMRQQQNVLHTHPYLIKQDKIELRNK